MNTLSKLVIADLLNSKYIVYVDPFGAEAYDPKGESILRSFRAEDCWQACYLHRWARQNPQPSDITEIITNEEA